MQTFKNKDGIIILLQMVKAIQEQKAYLGEVDGLIGDGDHGMNMNKGFTLFESRYAGEELAFTTGLEELGMILLNEIGGSMGPIYGTVFMEMAEAGDEKENISLTDLSEIIEAGLKGLQQIVEAQPGDKTLVDTLEPAVRSLGQSAAAGTDFSEALSLMIKAAEAGKDSTKDMVAKFGRSARLGERSRGVLDAGAVSCCILLTAMAKGIMGLL